MHSYRRLLHPFLLAFCLLLVVPIQAEITSSSYTEVKDQATLPILTPSFAKRKTRKLVLDNQLQVYLVSDPRAEKSAAALCVKAGSWDDPDEYPGMAHFVEHLLFLGTEEFPEESAFDQFAHQHGGTFNAYTALDHTCYLFSIDTDAFSQGLRRFSSFFKGPLFSPSGVGRELHAIDQEFSQHARRDSTRRWWVLQQITNPAHPNSRFRIGNLDTLSDVPREELLKWYTQHYSSNLMRLIIYSSMEMDALTQLVVQDFGGVPNRNLQASTGDQALFGPNTEQTISYADTLKDKRTLSLFWELPPSFIEARDSKPGHIVSHLLGHEGEQSLLASLKAEHYADSLSAGASDLGGRNYLFTMQIDLTKKGLKNLGSVLDRVFQAIEMLREQGVPDYVEEELQQVAQVNYQYQEPQDAFSTMQNWAQLIFDEDLASFPEQGFLLRSRDSEMVKNLVNQLKTSNLHINVMAPKKQLDVELNRQEPWGGTHFAVKKIPSEWLHRWNNLESHGSLTIPEANELIARDLNVLTKDRGHLSISPKPTLLQKDAFGEAYYALDEYYQVPMIYWSWTIKSPELDPGEPIQVVLAELYIKAVKEALNTYGYQAKLAGLKYDLQLEDDHITVAISGYSENARKLFKRILIEMQTVQPSRARFQDYKEVLSRQYSNFTRESPLKQAIEVTADVLHKDYSTHKEKSRVIKRITHSQFMAFARKLFNKNYSQALFYGNLSEQDARTTYQWMREQLGGEAYPPQEQHRAFIADLGKQSSPHYITVPSKISGNAVVLTLQNGPFSFTHRAAQQILNQGMKADFFTTLRTQQQTGYAVGNWDQEIERQLFFFFAVESDTHSGRDLLARFELFIETFLRKLGQEQLTTEQFKAIQEAFIVQLEKMPENLQTQGALLAKLMVEYDANFDWMEQRLEAMRSLEYTPFLEYAREVLGTQNRKRLAVLIEGKDPDHSLLEYKRLRRAGELRKQLDFQPR